MTAGKPSQHGGERIGALLRRVGPSGCVAWPAGCRCVRLMLLALLLCLVSPVGAGDQLRAVREAEETWELQDAGRLPARNVKLPLAYHPDGSVRAMMRAGTMWAPPVGLARAEEVEVVLYDVDRSVAGVMLAERSVIDRRRERTVCLGEVRIDYRGLVLRGTNAVWTATDSQVCFPDGAEVRLGRSFRKE